MPCPTGNCPLTSNGNDCPTFPPCPFIASPCWNTTVNITTNCVEPCFYSISSEGCCPSGTGAVSWGTNTVAGSQIVATVKPSGNCGQATCIPLSTSGDFCNSTANAGSFKSPCPPSSLDLSLSILPIHANGNDGNIAFPFAGPSQLNPCQFTASNFWVSGVPGTVTGPTITGRLFRTVNQCNSTACFSVYLNGSISA